MAHIYMSFDFGTNEDQAQLARHKLEMWRQAFRLDKKLLYKFERPGGDSAGRSVAGADHAEGGAAKAQGAAADGGKAKAAEKPGKGGKAAKGKGKTEAGKAKAEAGKVNGESAKAESGKTEPEKPVTTSGPVRLHLRLGFSGHEKMTEERLVKRIPAEEPFKDASPAVMRQGEPGFDETAAVFDALD